MSRGDRSSSSAIKILKLALDNLGTENKQSNVISLELFWMDLGGTEYE